MIERRYNRVNALRPVIGMVARSAPRSQVTELLVRLTSLSGVEETFVPSVWTAPKPCVGRVLVLPGQGYTVDHPLLFWACHVADSAGWQVSTMRWQFNSDAFASSAAFVELGAQALDAAAPAAQRTVVIAKSLGTLAAGWANQHGYPGVWLTPLLNDGGVSSALTKTPLALIVGGTRDRHWNRQVAGSLACEKVEVEGAGHALTVEGDWRASMAGLAITLATIETFLKEAAGADGISDTPGFA